LPADDKQLPLGLLVRFWVMSRTARQGGSQVGSSSNINCEQRWNEDRRAGTRPQRRAECADRITRRLEVRASLKKGVTELVVGQLDRSLGSSPNYQLKSVGRRTGRGGTGGTQAEEGGRTDGEVGWERQTGRVDHQSVVGWRLTAVTAVEKTRSIWSQKGLVHLRRTATTGRDPGRRRKGARPGGGV